MEDKILISLNKLSKKKVFPNGSKRKIFSDLSLSLSFSNYDNICLNEEIMEIDELLKIISGIEKADSGEIVIKINEEKVIGKFPYIPNESSLPEWLTVIENISLPFKFQDIPYSESEKRINEAIEICGLDGYENHISLSGSIGFNFRVELCRAVASEPKLIILQNPFSRFKEKDKADFSELIKNIFEKKGIHFLFTASKTDFEKIGNNRVLFIESI